MSEHAPSGVSVRLADADDELAVRRVLDGAMLRVEELQRRLDAGHVLVAVDGRSRVEERTQADGGRAGTVVGAIVVAPDGPDGDAGALPEDWRDDAHVRAVAVRRRRRGAGVGSALVRAVAAQFGSLVADFDADVRPFYESLGATVVRPDDGRCWARVPGST